MFEFVIMSVCVLILFIGFSIKLLKLFMTKNPKEKQKYNVGKIIAEIEFDGFTISEEFIGNVTQKYYSSRGHMFTYPISANKIFNNWKKYNQNTGFVCVKTNKFETLELPISKIKSIKTTYSNFIVEY